MEVKKSKKANLENSKALFFQIGIIFALGVILTAFEYSSKEKKVSQLDQQTAVFIPDEIVPPTQHEQPELPPEKPAAPVLSDEIDLVDDDIEVNDDFLKSLEDDPNLEINFIDYVSDIDEGDEIIEDIPYNIVEIQPSFQGGDASGAFNKWVQSQLDYPESAKENQISGKVTLKFTIDTDGNLVDLKVLRGVDSSLDKEALRVVSKSPKWTPGRQRDKAVRVSYTFPVVFQLR